MNEVTVEARCQSFINGIYAMIEAYEDEGETLMPINDIRWLL